MRRSTFIPTLDSPRALECRAAGHDAEQVVDTLLTYSRLPVPIRCWWMSPDDGSVLAGCGREAPDAWVDLRQRRRAVAHRSATEQQGAKGLLGSRVDEDTVMVHPSERGHLKQVLLKLGWPAEDLAGYVDGEAHEIGLDQRGWSLRPYQRQAADSFWHGGSGVVVLPCGAGKTIVGAAAMAGPAQPR